MTLFSMRASSTTNLVESTVSYTLPANLHITSCSRILCPPAGRRVVPLNGTGNELDNMHPGQFRHQYPDRGGRERYAFRRGRQRRAHRRFRQRYARWRRRRGYHVRRSRGADVFYFELANALHSIDQIRDFNTGEGDKIDIHELFDQLCGRHQNNLADFVKIHDQRHEQHPFRRYGRHGDGRAFHRDRHPEQFHRPERCRQPRRQR